MILGIDYGLRKIGIASSEGLYATPCATISNSPSRIQQITEKISGNIEKIVIGIPNSFLDPQVQKFADELHQHFKCQVVFQDETNTSNEALDTMIKSGVPRKKREIDDSFAAASILQRYLDESSDHNPQL